MVSVPQLRHSGGARLDGKVGASTGNGPEPGAGNDDPLLPPVKHSQVIVPFCTVPRVSEMREVGVSALSGADGTNTSVFDPAAATRVVKATVICPVSSSTWIDSTLRVDGGEVYPRHPQQYLLDLPARDVLARPADGVTGAVDEAK